MSFIYCTDTLPFGVDESEVFQKISDEFLLENHLLWVSPEELQDSFRKGLSMIVLDRTEPVAHTRILRLPCEPEFYELGATWVSKERRGQKLCHLMYGAFLPGHEEKNILATTDVPGARKVGEHLGFVTVFRRLLPEAVWRASCTCGPAKTGTQDNAHCKLAYGEKRCAQPCWFRVTRPTAERLGLV